MFLLEIELLLTIILKLGISKVTICSKHLWFPKQSRGEVRLRYSWIWTKRWHLSFSIKLAVKRHDSILSFGYPLIDYHFLCMYVFSSSLSTFTWCFFNFLTSWFALAWSYMWCSFSWHLIDDITTTYCWKMLAWVEYHCNTYLCIISI